MALLDHYLSVFPGAGQVAINLAVTLLILIAGWVASSLAGRCVRRLALHSASRIDLTIVPMLVSVTVWTIRTFVAVAVLARLGVQTASIITLLGAAGLAIGLALQGTLQNIAAGLMLLILRPVRAGEYVSVVGKGDGTVDEVGLFMTRLIQFDGVHLLLPNSLIWGNPLINYSRNATRRLDIAVGVRYGDDLDLAMSTLHALIDGYPDVLADPAPSVMASEYRDSAVMLNLRLWTPADQYWNVRFGLYRDAVKALQQAGLKTPIPLREVQSAQPEPAVNGD